METVIVVVFAVLGLVVALLLVPVGVGAFFGWLRDGRAGYWERVATEFKAEADDLRRELRDLRGEAGRRGPMR